MRGEAPEHNIRYEIIDLMKEDYPITWLVEISDTTRSGFYKWMKNGRNSLINNKDCELKEIILDIHQKHKHYGYPRMKVALRERGYLVNHKKVLRLMRELGVQSIIRKKRRVWGNKVSRVFDNILNRRFKNREINEVLVTDITYIPTKDGFVYLSAIQDLFNNEIVAWKMSTSNNLRLVMDTFEELAMKRNVYRSIIHSDQGFQYTSHEYHRKVQELGMIGSHSRKGNCHDNACIESFFSHLKSDCYKLLYLETAEEIMGEVEEFIYEYNYKRFQKRLNDLAPIEYRCQIAA